ALWFTEIAAKKIGRITASGAVTEFALGSNPGNPREITAGPDGALWFTLSAVSAVGRINTEGDVTEFTLPNAGSLEGITAGPDGNLWFTDTAAGGKVRRVTTAGRFYELP